MGVYPHPMRSCQAFEHAHILVLLIHLKIKAYQILLKRMKIRVDDPAQSLVFVDAIKRKATAD